MRVRIDAGERVVEVETLTDANLTHEALTAQALAIWRATEGSSGAGPAYGFSAQVQPHQPRDQYAWRMGNGQQLPVCAEEG